MGLRPAREPERVPLQEPLLVWKSSVMGGSASSWMVGTDARRPDQIKEQRQELVKTSREAPPPSPGLDLLSPL